jgi:hypothetical protein
VAQYIFQDSQLTYTNQAFASNRNQSSVILMQSAGKQFQLTACSVSKLGFPDDLPRSLAIGYNAAILCVRTNFYRDVAARC